MKKLLLILVCSFCFNGYASDSSSGCGPGWFVAKDNSLLSSALRVTTNGALFPIVTLGMTFGTSNCSKHSIVKNEVEDLKFATENYFEIAVDTAKGDGMFLQAYADLMGCSGTANKKFKNHMQKNFKNLFDGKSVRPANLVEETYKVILRDESLTKSCFSV